MTNTEIANEIIEKYSNLTYEHVLDSIEDSKTLDEQLEKFRSISEMKAKFQGEIDRVLEEQRGC